MMKYVLFNNPISRRLMRSQRGQSIVLLAFAFIALVAFVGLVTDLALLFVRYAALRRAVDAAAIAAAGQIREGTDYGEVAIAAQQYIRLHNLEPDSILVETCETDIMHWRAGTGEFEDEGPHPESLYPPPVSNWMPNTELCDWGDPHKLVRVSAQIISPTTFLSLIGIGHITLEATSVSETAVLDVALVIDTSESMSRDTKATSYTQVGWSLPVGGGLPTSARAACWGADGVSFDIDRGAWAGCCNDPGHGNVGDGSLQANGVVVPNGLIWHDTNGNGMYDGAHENGLANSLPQSTSLTNPDGFNFTTLVCAPFKDVKDAARMFIKRLDFVRGDRVVLVTFDRQGVPYAPINPATGQRMRPLLRSEATAIDTLNTRIGVQINPTGLWDKCQLQNTAYADWNAWLQGDLEEPPELRPNAYETIASCGNTNIGGGILAANNALTDPVDVRREAVWVMIVLSDGAANVTNQVPDIADPLQYGYWGYCPWWTFCYLDEGHVNHWPECTENNPSQVERALPICNDNDPDTRHFCIDWDTGLPDPTNSQCETRYDADDYARDMADFAGLIEVSPGGTPGNFIAMFALLFGEQVLNEPTAAPLMRYIADAGDNGFIDNNLQQDWRDNRQFDGGDYTRYGDPDVCEGKPQTEQCGQYYYARDLADLTQVFEDIASRMFTRLAR
mgnify:FL=1